MPRTTELVMDRYPKSNTQHTFTDRWKWHIDREFPETISTPSRQSYTMIA